MAGRGPAPKPAAERRRRNRLPDERTVQITGPVPAPPLARGYRIATADGPREVRWLAATRDWYDAWCATPMAEGWLLVHYLRLQELAVLRDQFTRTGHPKLAAELRIGIAAFGGSPADMRRLGITIDTDHATHAPSAPRPPRRRSNLFAVPDAAESS